MSDYYSTVEEEKFGALAEDWWDLNGSVKTLHDINPIRLQYIQEKIDLKGTNILDIGCGGGILSESLARCGALVTAIDTSEELIKIAENHATTMNLQINYETTDVATFSGSQANQFDAVICMELIEHVDNVYSLIKDCRNLLQKNGILMMSTITRTALSYIFGILTAEDLLKIVPKGTHDYNKFIKPSELAACCRTMKFENIDVKGLNYNPFSRRANISDRVRVNYISTFLAL